MFPSNVKEQYIWCNRSLLAKRKEMWNAYIFPNGTKINLGYFTDFEEARQARYDAEDKCFGEFAAHHSRPRVPMKDLFSRGLAQE